MFWHFWTLICMPGHTLGQLLTLHEGLFERKKQKEKNKKHTYLYATVRKQA